MATTERPDEHARADRVAASLGDAGFVRVVAAPRGDALAALGVLCRALDARGVPFQGAVRRAGDADDAGEAEETVALGLGDADATHGFASDPVSEAYAVASALSTPDAVLGLAGAVAGCGAAGTIVEDPTAAGVSRRPGLAVPTADPVDGLVHTSLVHGPFSGDADAARELVGEFEASEDARRRLASDVALAVAESAPPATRAGTALERVLRPHVGGPFETLGGYADVLDALARGAPGLGIATALGVGDPETALECWRSHGRAVHEGVAGADLRRHDGLAVATVEADDAALEPVARLLRDFRSPEPAVLVFGRDRSALAVGDGADARALLRDCVADGRPVDGAAGVAAVDPDGDDVEAAVRDALGGDR
jgi:hypothetical protein